jgi:glycosyltransferase involved in cell wall biosynthesis
MSVATLEAMASGLPVITTRSSGMDELVNEGANGFFVEWADVDDLAVNILRLTRNSELIFQMGSASREISANYSWQAAADAYLKLFDNIKCLKD